ncbi:MAG: hypothetical protein HPY80_05660 [Bacteroidales bacterium]|jgi:hypothetical protein|nr:hypothetical protein [Bacteroidales bacterium]NPV36137.1 hypothetical protein [Bacteroidales bacterium]
MKSRRIIIFAFILLGYVLLQFWPPIQASAEENKAKDWVFRNCGWFAGHELKETTCTGAPVPSCTPAPCGIWLPPVVID